MSTYTLTFKSRDEIPEAFRDYAKEETAQDGSRVYKVNVVPNERLREFRDKNISLVKEREELAAVYESLKPILEEFDGDVNKFLDFYREATSVYQKVQDGKLKTSDEIEQAVRARIENVQKSYERKLREAEQKAQNLEEKLRALDEKHRQFRLESEVRSLLADQSLGINPQAFKAVLAEVREIFHVEDDGRIVPKDPQTGEIIWDDSGTQPLSLKQWAKEKLPEIAPYVFTKNQGASTSGGTNSGLMHINPDELRKKSAAELYDMYVETLKTGNA